MKKLILIFPVVLIALTSCIGIESRISFNRDGSGILTLNYTVSHMIKNLGGAGNEAGLPLPVNKEEFDRTAGSIDGLYLESISQREDEENIYIEATMRFDSVEALNEIGDQMNMSLQNDGARTTFRQIIYSQEEGDQISEDSVAMVETVFKNYDLVFIIDAPSAITEHSSGQLSEQGRRLTYRVTIPELMRSDGQTVLEANW